MHLLYKKDYFSVSKKIWDYLKKTYGSDHQIECDTKDISTFHKGSTGSYISTRTTSPSISHSTSSKILHTSRIIKSKSSKEFQVSESTRNSRIINVRVSPQFQSKFNQSMSKPLLNGIVGLKNTGCNCYMNTILQCILSINNLTKAILKIKKETPFITILKDFYMQIKSGVGDGRKFSNYFQAEFPSNKQHDAPEFLRKILDVIDKELTPKKITEECDP